MDISYDTATDSLYVHLADKASVNSDEVTDGAVLDFDANGALVGIDVQHASRRITNDSSKGLEMNTSSNAVRFDDGIWQLDLMRRLKLSAVVHGQRAQLS